MPHDVVDAEAPLVDHVEVSTLDRNRNARTIVAYNHVIQNIIANSLVTRKHAEKLRRRESDAVATMKACASRAKGFRCPSEIVVIDDLRPLVAQRRAMLHQQIDANPSHFITGATREIICLWH